VSFEVVALTGLTHCATLRVFVDSFHVNGGAMPVNRSVASARAAEAPLFLARAATRPPRDLAFATTLIAISGSGSIASLGLLFAGNPDMAARIFSGAVLLLLGLLVASAQFGGRGNSGR
jgi:hypothetical protein